MVLGSTSKAGRADDVGSFGEGYKIALLVLTRNGYDVKVLNGNKQWVPEFRHSGYTLLNNNGLYVYDLNYIERAGLGKMT